MNLKSDLDKEDLKAMYNNYFLQVQTLINQKAIGTGSTGKEERKTAARSTRLYCSGACKTAYVRKKENIEE